MGASCLARGAELKLAPDSGPRVDVLARSRSLLAIGFIRVTIVEPGFVETELQGHNEHPSVVEGMEQMREKIGKVLEPRDIAGAVLFAISQPEHVAVNEILVRPTRQER